ALGLPLAGDVRLGAAAQSRDALVREAEALPADEVGEVCAFFDFPFGVDEGGDLADEPGVDRRQRGDLAHRDASTACFCDPEEAPRAGDFDLGPDPFQVSSGVVRLEIALQR